MGDKCKLMRPKTPRVRRQVWETSGETSVNSCSPRKPECETSGRQCKMWETSERQVGRQVEETSVNSCGPRHPDWEWETSGKQVGDKCKLMRPKAPRVGDKCGRQVWKTSVNSCGPRHPEWETCVGDKCGKQVGDKCKLMRPKTPRVGDKCGRQV